MLDEMMGVYMTGRYMEIDVVAGGATEKGGWEKT